MTSYRLAEIARHIGCDIDSRWQDRSITGLASLETANQNQLTFISQPKYKKYLTATQAGAIIASADMLLHIEDRIPVLVHADPYLAYAKVSQLFCYRPSQSGIHPTAIIDPSAKVAASAAIGPYVVIEKNAVINENVVIGAHSTIGEETIIGENSYLHAHVTIYHHVTVGKRAIIHSGAIIGADGFGFAPERGHWVKIEQLGGVVIGDDVEIGASTTIDRGALGDTIIHNFVKIDNQIQIGHNVVIGEGTAIAGCTGIAGSTTIGKYCRIAGFVGIAGHLQITDGVVIMAMSGVSNSILEPGIYAAGIPVLPRETWASNVIQFKHLNELSKRVAKLEEKDESL